MSSSNPMSQGYQSEFLTYVKRTTTQLPNGPVARTTTRYGRPIGGGGVVGGGPTSPRSAGHIVDLTPAARKFPDNSPLNEGKCVSSGGAAGGSCSSKNETRVGGSTESEVEKSTSSIGNEESKGARESSTVDEARDPTGGGKPSLGNSGGSGYHGGFASTSFYGSGGKLETIVSRMKDRDHVGGTSDRSNLSPGITNTDVISNIVSSNNTQSRHLGDTTGDPGGSRTSRRNSPAASVNGDDTISSRSMRKPASPTAANGSNSNTSSASSISSNNSTLVHMLRSGPATRLPSPLQSHFNNSKSSASSQHQSNNNSRNSEGQPNQNRHGSSSVRSDTDDSQGGSSDRGMSSTRSSRNAPAIPRPKRHIIPKNMEMGLSWREQNDLKKALYASLQESKHPGEGGAVMENGSVPATNPLCVEGKKRSVGGSKYWMSLSVDDSSQESTRSGVSSESNSSGLLKVRAQRKFAAGSRPGSPGTTPVKNKGSPRKFFTTKKAKTEDFLTFLCLRGSHMLPPHLDFSKIDDSEDCFQSSSTPNTPRSSRPGTPAMAGLGLRDITPRGGRVAAGSRCTTPDKDISLDDNDLGVRPLAVDTTSPISSPNKRVVVKSPTPSPAKAQVGSKRKSTSKFEDDSGSDKKSRGQEKDESFPRKKEKDKNRKKKKEKEAAGGKLKKKEKKKKRKEEAKLLRRKLVMRARSTVAKASKRKLELASTTEKTSKRSLRGTDPQDSTVEKPTQHLASISSILEGLTTRRGVGRPKKNPEPLALDNVTQKSSSTPGKTRSEKRQAEQQQQQQPITRTRSPETRASTRASSRSVSPYKSPPATRTPSHESERQSTTSTDGLESSSKPGSSKKDFNKQSHSPTKDKHKELRSALKKITRSESRLQDAGLREPCTSTSSGSAEQHKPPDESIPSVGPSNPEPMYRTRSLPLLTGTSGLRSPQPQPKSQKIVAAVRRVVAPIGKSAKKSASEAPAMPGITPPEKRGRGRPPGSGKKNISILKMSFRAPFPSPSDPGQVVEIPTYHPSSEQFQDPISYIQSIRADAEPFGMCRIIPPDGWKPECKFPDDLKFMTQMQYIHRMRNRWGPNALALECIRQHLQSQGIKLEQAPMVGGVELDLPALSETLQHFGGMQSVIDKNKWPKVIESLRIPKIAPERCSKLYDSYCKFLLSYDTLPAEEKACLEQHVLTDKERAQLTNRDECVIKGRIRHLSDFFRHSRNMESVWFRKEPNVEEVEELYWNLVEGGEHHVAVQAAEVDTKVCGSGFPTKKDSPYSNSVKKEREFPNYDGSMQRARFKELEATLRPVVHGWNLNILQYNSGSVLGCLGHVSGVTVPVLHVGMTFSTKCWSANDHLLPQVVYKHTGADTIWYCLPASEESKFHSVCRKLVPEHADDDPVWLLDDTLMISPETLTEHGVSLGRTTLSPGQFLFVFPEAFTSSVSCGYNLSESLHFATADWIPLGAKAAQMLHDSGVPEQFSMDRLLCKLARYEKTPLETLEHVLPQLEQVVEREVRERQELEEAGLTAAEKMCVFDDDAQMSSSNRKRHKYEVPDQDENVCDVSKKICYLSMVLNEAEDTVYSLEHALTHIQKKRNLKVCKLLYRYTIDELNAILNIVKSRLAGDDPDPFSGPPVKKKASK